MLQFTHIMLLLTITWFAVASNIEHSLFYYFTKRMRFISSFAFWYYAMWIYMIILSCCRYLCCDHTIRIAPPKILYCKLFPPTLPETRSLLWLTCPWARTSRIICRLTWLPALNNLCLGKWQISPRGGPFWATSFLARVCGWALRRIVFKSLFKFYTKNWYLRSFERLHGYSFFI